MNRAKILARRIEHTPTEPPRGHIVHVVHKGDSVWRILKRYRVSRAVLASFNPDVNLRQRLRRGAKIVIPVQKKQEGKARKRDRVSLLK